MFWVTADVRVGSKPVGLKTSKSFPVSPRKRTSDLRVNEYTPLLEQPSLTSLAVVCVASGRPSWRRPHSVRTLDAVGVLVHGLKGVAHNPSDLRAPRALPSPSPDGFASSVGSISLTFARFSSLNSLIPGGSRSSSGEAILLAASIERGSNIVTGAAAVVRPLDRRRTGNTALEAFSDALALCTRDYRVAPSCSAR